MHKKLFIPGPVDVRPDVLEKMATKQIGHRTKEASELQENIEKKLQKVFKTKNHVLISTSSGTGLMEGAMRSFIKEKAAVFSCGAFGDKFYKICKANGKAADICKKEMGNGFTTQEVVDFLKRDDYDLMTIQHNETSTGVINPIGDIIREAKKLNPEIIVVVDAVSSLAGMDIPCDEWQIDVLITSSQKCFGLPAGISFASVSDRAIEKAKGIENRGLYFDYLTLYKYNLEKHQYPSTPTLSHMFALDYQLDLILEEGLENRFKRHSELAEIVREFGEEYFKLFVKDPNYRSDTVTCIENNRGVDIADLNLKLAEKGYMISNGYGELKDKTFRISHMADYTKEDIVGVLEAIKEVLKLNGDE
ncbi:MAG: alanine--glyoxylate aminotransferase family protein [Tissierellia bacterium]|nr:alanine--glyoxylate aminotransferase family protein [Tissierellia bacterium]